MEYDGTYRVIESPTDEYIWMLADGDPDAWHVTLAVFGAIIVCVTAFVFCAKWQEGRNWNNRNRRRGGWW